MSKKLKKKAKYLNWGRKSLYLLNKLINFNENFRNDVTCGSIKTHKFKTLPFLKKNLVLEKIIGDVGLGQIDPPVF